MTERGWVHWEYTQTLLLVTHYNDKTDFSAEFKAVGFITRCDSFKFAKLSFSGQILYSSWLKSTIFRFYLYEN